MSAQTASDTTKRKARSSDASLTEDLKPPKMIKTESRESIQRHSDLWFDDGNITLIADNLAFRVHKSQLARRSPVFKEWFAKATFRKYASGCEYTKVDHSEEDMEVFLDALYNGPR